MEKTIKKITSAITALAMTLSLIVGFTPAIRAYAAGDFKVYLGDYDTRIYAGGINDIEIYTDLPEDTKVTYQWQCGYESWSGSGMTWLDLDDNDKWHGTKTPHLQFFTPAGESWVDTGWEDFEFRCVVKANGKTKYSTSVRMYIYETDKLYEDLDHDKLGSINTAADGAVYFTSADAGSDYGQVYAGQQLKLSMSCADLSKYSKYAQSEVEFAPWIVIKNNNKKTISNSSYATCTPLAVGNSILMVTYCLDVKINGTVVGTYKSRTATFDVLTPKIVAEGTAKYDCHTLNAPYNEATRLDELSKGETVEIVDNSGTWYKVLKNDIVGFVPATAIELAETDHTLAQCRNYLVYHPGEPATCTEPGTDDFYVCTKCGRVYVKEGDTAYNLVMDSGDLTISPKGHDWSEWTLIKSPTATEEGVEERVCSHDPDHREQRAVPKLDPTYPGVRYRTYVQKKGWLPWVENGAMSGTKGSSLRMEAMKVGLTDASGTVRYRAYVQKEGWQAWKQNEAMSGTKGQNKRLEAVQIKLDGDVALDCNIWYRVYAQKFGWMGWTANGQSAGTSGYAYRLEAIQIRLLNRSASAPGKTDNAYSKKQ